ncbi:MAG TPA: hypothetical protein VFF19_22620, partial [Reyranella sp.]|nr:hypothetical protein [Reyranella sp.]
MTDFTQFPKNRGAFNGPGRQDARELANSDVAFLKKRRANGSLAEKKGEFLYVSGQQVGEDGFYSLGAIGGETRIVGSATARGTFTDRGPAPAEGGFSTGQLAFYGRGMGEVLKTQAIGNFLDFDGKSCQMFKQVIARTRNGRALTDYYDVNVFIPFGTGNTRTFAVPGGYHDLGGAPTFWAGHVYSTLLEDGQHAQMFARDDGADSVTLGAVEMLPDQLGWYADPIRLAPAVMVKMDRYLRPTYAPTAVDAAACLGLYFTHTVDAGVTWSPIATNSLFQDELDTITAMPTSGANAAVFNAAVAAADLRSAPLSRSLSVVLARVPYVDLV